MAAPIPRVMVEIIRQVVHGVIPPLARFNTADPKQEGEERQDPAEHDGYPGPVRQARPLLLSPARVRLASLRFFGECRTPLCFQSR